MLALSQTTGYAILALGCLSRNPGAFVLAKDIAKCTGIPWAYLSKVLHTLEKHGIVESRRGYRGGFRLRRPAEQVSLEDIAAVLERQWPPQCLLGFQDCQGERNCPFHEFWQREREVIREKLRSTTLGDLTASPLMIDQVRLAWCGSGRDGAAQPRRGGRKQKLGPSKSERSKSDGCNSA
ncbi:Rrf2 family transcriptional regulator [Thermogutta sp.]|jgi:Rrf2 family protein|uniref:RrF2 family transcriptional regulator n=1 Tax=Thermogutta sp. TaxID=1962930 RepID=UPI00322011F2